MSDFKPVRFKYGNQSSYDSLSSIEEGTLYFIIDTKRLYRGNQLISLIDVLFVDHTPAHPEEGIVYIVTDTDPPKICGMINGEFKVIGGEIADGSITFIKLNSDLIGDLSNPSESTLATTQEIYNFINDKIDHLGVVATTHTGPTQSNTYTPEGEIINGAITVYSHDETNRINEITDVGSLTDGTYQSHTFEVEDENLIIGSTTSPTNVSYNPPTFVTRDLTATQEVSVFRGTSVDLAVQVVTLTQVSPVSISHDLSPSYGEIIITQE